VIPIMAGGIGEGAIPLSIGYSEILHQEQGVLSAVRPGSSADHARQPDRHPAFAPLRIRATLPCRSMKPLRTRDIGAALHRTHPEPQGTNRGLQSAPLAA
jgi:hypothetical protein